MRGEEGTAATHLCASPCHKSLQGKAGCRLGRVTGHSVSAFAEVGSAADEGDSGSSSGTSTFSQPSTSPPIESYIIELMAGELMAGELTGGASARARCMRVSPCICTRPAAEHLRAHESIISLCLSRRCSVRARRLNVGWCMVNERGQSKQWNGL